MQPNPGNNPRQAPVRLASRDVRASSLIPKNLAANPYFVRIYEKIFKSEHYNFNETKDLSARLQKKLRLYIRRSSARQISIDSVACQLMPQE
jgi:hypothetical protein